MPDCYQGVASYSGTKLTLSGDKDLKELLESLGPRVARKGLRGAMSAAASPIVKAAKADAPKEAGGGFLKKAIGKKVKTYGDGRVVAIIGAKSGVSGEVKGRKRVPARYLHLVEKGTKPHRINLGGQSIKQGVAGLSGGTKQHPGAKANPFLERAFEATKAAALAIAQAKLTEVVEKEAAKKG